VPSNRTAGMVVTAPVTFRWHDQSPDPQDGPPLRKGIATSLLEGLDRDGERISWLRISFTTKALVDELFSRPSMWKANRHGWCGDTTTPSGLWLTLSRHMVLPSRRGRHLWNETPVPDPVVLDRDLAAADRQIRAEFDRWVAYYQQPFVAAVRVEDRWLRQGIATAMYLRAAAELARTDRVLRASSLQSDEAVWLWASLRRKGLTGSVTVTNPTSGSPETYDTVALLRPVG
jgi:hypothetical protein